MHVKQFVITINSPNFPADEKKQTHTHTHINELHYFLRIHLAISLFKYQLVSFEQG